MPKRDLRVVKRTPIALGICERCNLQFSSNESAEDDAEAELWAQVDNHKCQSGDANPEHAKPASVGYGVSPTHLSNSKWVPSVRP